MKEGKIGLSDPPPPPPMKTPPSLSIELAVRLNDGSFDSKVSFLVSAPKQERDNFVAAWLDTMKHALAMAKDRSDESAS